LTESHEISQNEAFCFWFQFFWGQVMLTARSFKEPNDEELSSALLGPGKIEKTRNAWFGKIFVRSSKISILTFRQEVAEVGF